VGGNVVVDFIVVFAVIGGLELIDRTNFALISLAAKQHPASVWAGATAAFVLTTLFAVAIGAALLAALGGQIEYLRLGGGAFLLAYAGYLFFVPESNRRIPTGRSTFTTAFLLILLLELGDTTMIVTIIFVGSLAGEAILIGVAAALALACVAASASLIGSRLGARVEPAVLERVVVVILVIVGIVTIVSAIEPSLLPSVAT
jgi:putative Ca2+/H+ antiporter (TMEM165/GDT1 family)